METTPKGTKINKGFLNKWKKYVSNLEEKLAQRQAYIETEICDLRPDDIRSFEDDLVKLAPEEERKKIKKKYIIADKENDVSNFEENNVQVHIEHNNSCVEDIMIIEDHLIEKIKKIHENIIPDVQEDLVEVQSNPEDRCTDDIKIIDDQLAKKLALIEKEEKTIKENIIPYVKVHTFEVHTESKDRCADNIKVIDQLAKKLAPIEENIPEVKGHLAKKPTPKRKKEKRIKENIIPNVKGGTAVFVQTEVQTEDVRKISIQGSTSKYEIDFCFSTPSRDFEIIKVFRPLSYFKEPESLRKLEQLKTEIPTKLTMDDFFFLYELIVTVLQSNIVDLLYNRDWSYIHNNIETFFKWHEEAKRECKQINKYLPKNLIRVFVTYLKVMMYQKPAVLCQREVESRLTTLYMFCGDRSLGNSVEERLVEEIKKLCRNHDKNAVMGCAKKIRMDLSNTCMQL